MWVALLHEDVSTLGRDAKPCSFTHPPSQDICSQEGSEETRFLGDHIGSPTTTPHSYIEREYSANQKYVGVLSSVFLCRLAIVPSCSSRCVVELFNFGFRLSPLRCSDLLGDVGI